MWVGWCARRASMFGCVNHPPLTCLPTLPSSCAARLAVCELGRWLAIACVLQLCKQACVCAGGSAFACALVYVHAFARLTHCLPHPHTLTGIQSDGPTCTSATPCLCPHRALGTTAQPPTKNMLHVGAGAGGWQQCVSASPRGTCSHNPAPTRRDPSPPPPIILGAAAFCVPVVCACRVCPSDV